jgi:hypothetical protein
MSNMCLCCDEKRFKKRVYSHYIRDVFQNREKFKSSDCQETRDIEHGQNLFALLSYGSQLAQLPYCSQLYRYFFCIGEKVECYYNHLFLLDV